MRCVGTVVRGIRTSIIKENDDLASIVVESLMKAKESEGFEFRDKDIVGITEAVVSIAQGNYATLDDIVIDLNNKYPNKELGIVFPILSRNRFSMILKAIARACNKITILLSYPADEVGNGILDESLLAKINNEVITEEEYMNIFGNYIHPFTGLNMVNYYRDLVKKENCEVEFVLSNNPRTILNYQKDILACDIHSRFKTKKILSDANTIYGLDDILNKSINGSGYNSKYGLLGSNKSTEETIKLFPEHGDILVNKVSSMLKEKTGKNIEVLIYGDGAFKDPVGGIWELADPMVSPFYTKGLEGTPSELKLKYLSDNKFSHLKGEELKNAIKNEIINKELNTVGKMDSLGTTPRRLTDLIGSLCDLTSGSGDKGTPVVFIQGYFDNLADE